MHLLEMLMLITVLTSKFSHYVWFWKNAKIYLYYLIVKFLIWVSIWRICLVIHLAMGELFEHRSWPCEVKIVRTNAIYAADRHDQVKYCKKIDLMYVQAIRHDHAPHYGNDLCVYGSMSNVILTVALCCSRCSHSDWCQC